LGGARIPTTVPTPWLLRGFLLFCSVLAIALVLTLAVRSSSATTRVILSLMVVALLALATRVARMRVDVGPDGVRVKNLFRTSTVPVADIERFDVAWNLMNGCPALAIVTKSGGRITCDAYPITRVPPVSRRRREVVDELNAWLRTRAAEPW